MNKKTYDDERIYNMFKTALMDSNLWETDENEVIYHLTNGMRFCLNFSGGATIFSIHEQWFYFYGLEANTVDPMSRIVSGHIAHRNR